jgi:hypothetical protein
MKKVGFIALALVLALGSLGAAYAMWDKILYIDGTVMTGEVNAEFVDAFTDDDGTVNDVTKDDGDDGGGTLYDHWGASSSNDPNMAGPNPTREDKDVGRCSISINQEDPQILHFTVENGYPCYWNTAWFLIKNTGTIPVHLESVTCVPDPAYPFTPGEELTVELTAGSLGLQIHPGETAWGSLAIHVEQPAAELATYKFDCEIQLVQWNESVYPAA